MQDRYVADVGDFAKYALIRSLVSGAPRPPRLGVNWYMFPDETHNGDGRHISYLTSEAYAGLDPSLHTALRDIVASGRRSVHSVRTSGVLPADTLHFSEAFPGRPACSVAVATEERRLWAGRAYDLLHAADLVFLDPDNGLEAASVKPGSPKWGKYVLWEEAATYWERGQSLLIYHHLNRTMSVADQVELIAIRFRERLGNVPHLSIPVFRRGSCRAFCVLGQARHAARLVDGESDLLSRGWSAHFARPA